MSMFEEVQREETRLRIVEEVRIDEERRIKRLKEAYGHHFMNGQRFIEKLSFQFQKNDRQWVFEQLSTELKHQSKQVMERLEEDEDTLLQQKRKLQTELEEIAVRKREISAKGGKHER